MVKKSVPLWQLLLIAGIGAFSLAFIICVVIIATTRRGWFLLLFLPPVAPMALGFVLAFFEQRLRRHLLPILVATVATFCAMAVFAENVTEETWYWVITRPLPIVWLIGLVGSLFGTLLSRRLSAFKRVPPGLCSSCGYDLRGCVSGICPECGKSYSLAHEKDVPP